MLRTREKCPSKHLLNRSRSLSFCSRKSFRLRPILPARGTASRHGRSGLGARGSLPYLTLPYLTLPYLTPTTPNAIVRHQGTVKARYCAYPAPPEEEDEGGGEGMDHAVTEARPVRALVMHAGRRCQGKGEGGGKGAMCCANGEHARRDVAGLRDVAPPDAQQQIPNCSYPNSRKSSYTFFSFKAAPRLHPGGLDGG